MTIKYQDLAKHFLFGGPVKYDNKRCHVVGMNDLLKTVTLECNGEKMPVVKPKEVGPYDETGRSD